MSREYGYQWRARLLDNGFTNSLRLYIAQDTFVPGAPAKIKIWKLDKFTEMSEGEMFPAPTLEGPRAVIAPFIQAIVDEAWRNGIKPTELALHEMENRTQLAHLNDMRAIVAHELKVKL